MAGREPGRPGGTSELRVGASMAGAAASAASRQTITPARGSDATERAIATAHPLSPTGCGTPCCAVRGPDAPPEGGAGVTNALPRLAFPAVGTC